MAYVGILVCILFSGFFSAAEISYSSLSLSRFRTKAELGDKQAGQILYILENFDRALSTILIGNNLVNIAASSMATVILSGLWAGRGTLVATVLMTIMILIFGESTPKILAKDHPEAFARASSRFLKYWMILLTPVNALIMKFIQALNHVVPMPDTHIPVSQARLSSLIESGESEGIIDQAESDLMLSALEFLDITVGEIVTPRVDMAALNIAADWDETIQEIMRTPYSRLPVYEETLDDIIGVLHVSNFLKVLVDRPHLQKEEFIRLLHPVIAIPESLTLPKAFRMLNQGTLQLGIVVDDFGGTVGCVTVEDLLEELVGDIWDEVDVVEKDIREISPGEYEISGDISLRDFADYLDLDYEQLQSDYNTLGGLLLEQLERFPEEGEVVDFGRLHFTIQSMDDKRLDKVRLKISEKVPGRN